MDITVFATQVSTIVQLCKANAVRTTALRTNGRITSLRLTGTDADYVIAALTEHNLTVPPVPVIH